MPKLGFANEPFQQVVYFEAGASGSGKAASDAAALDDADAFALPAGTLVTNCYVIVDEAVTGASTWDVGDDDDADGFVPAASVTLATPGVYGFGAAEKGAYLQATGDARAKLYAAAGKSVKCAADAAGTAGKLRVVVEGFYLGR